MKYKLELKLKLLLIVAAITLIVAVVKGEKCTWYHPRLEGNLMANGHPFDQLRYTCASYAYPIGTMLCVTNVTNNRAVIVEVTDRHDHKTDIDLSFIAYTEVKDFDWNDEGHITVRVEEVK